MTDTAQTLLIIEDDAQTRRSAALALSSLGYRVVEAEGMEVGYHLFQTHCPSLVILDLRLPDGDGVELCRKIRAHQRLATTPVIMLTGKGELDDKALGIEAGADQYLVKPVHPRELTLWVHALLRRLRYDQEEDGGQIHAGELSVEPAAHLLRWREATVANLTGKEFDLFYMLVKQRPKVLSRRYILSKVWQTVSVDAVVDSHLHNLRRKLPRELADKIQSVPGKGFRFFE